MLYISYLRVNLVILANFIEIWMYQLAIQQSVMYQLAESLVIWLYQLYQHSNLVYTSKRRNSFVCYNKLHSNCGCIKKLHNTLAAVNYKNILYSSCINQEVTHQLYKSRSYTSIVLYQQATQHSCYIKLQNILYSNCINQEVTYQIMLY